MSSIRRLGALIVVASAALGPAAAQTGAPPPSWDQALPASTRFVVLTSLGGEAVLDRETGLVWERAPNATATLWDATTPAKCLNRTTGGRKGWRVPAIFELASLIDPTVTAPAAMLPPGHPFKLPRYVWLWSSTRDSNVSPLMWGVNTFDGTVGQYHPATAGMMLWCVRGPSQQTLH